MALKNNDSHDKKLILTYMIVPSILIVIGFALLYVLLNKDNNQMSPQASPAVIEQASGGDAQEPQVEAVAMAVGKFKGETPEIINILDSMGGFKEDKSVAAADTVYVIYDPRCPYCKELYDKLKTTDLKGKEITIKWLPSVALGIKDENDPAIKRAAHALSAKNVAEFEATLSDSYSSEEAVSEEAAMRLEENMAFLFEASNQTFGNEHPKSVPAAFFVDKTTGQPQMMYGASSESVFRVIFGD